MSEKLTIKEACIILNEGVSQGSWQGSSTSYTSGNAYTIGYDNDNTHISTHTSTSTSTKWVDNEWYISEAKLKEYALCGAVPYGQDGKGNICFEYEDILTLRKDTHAVWSHYKESIANYPQKLPLILGIFSSIIITIIGFAISISACDKLSGQIESIKMIIGFVVMFISIILAGVCIYLIGSHRYKIRDQHTAILKEPISMKQFRQTHTVQ